MRRFRQLSAVAALGVTMALSSGSAGAQNAAAGSARSQDKPSKFFLGVLAQNEFWKEAISGANQIANSVKGSVDVRSSNFDGQKLLQEFGTVLAEGCEKCALVVDPVSGATTRALVDRSANAGAYIVTLYNRPEAIHPWDTQSNHWVAHISYDGFSRGYANAMALCRKLNGKGNIVALEGMPDDPTAKRIMAGLHKALAECPGMKLLDTQVGNFMMKEGERITRSWLTKGTKFDGIFSANGGMAEGAVAALHEQGLAGKVFVTGGIGLLSTLKLVKSGEMLATSFNDPAVLGAVGAALAHAAAVGDITLSKLKPHQRDFYLKHGQLVTAENVDTFIKLKGQANRFSYQEMRKDFWAFSEGQIPVDTYK